MTKDKKQGPFKRKDPSKSRNLSIHAPWTGMALAIIAITQIPIGLRATMEIGCLTAINKEASPHLVWCKKS